jgi:DNA (cytosine-5)-methyltransferase 1
MILRRRSPASSRARGTVLDLFSGSGGLSLGFQTAGFDVIGGVEVDPAAAATHGANFHPGSPQHARPRSVVAHPLETLKDLGCEEQPHVEVLVGGPPCQAFARVGRAKLRAESARRSGPTDHRAWLEDPRVGLYANYLEYVDVLRPLALVMENVPDVLNHGGDNHAEAVCEELERHGYDVAYTLLNAVHFGVPQMRERMFLIGLRRDLRAGPVTFPSPTHSHTLPQGYALTRACALAGEGGSAHYAELEQRHDLPAATTAAEALHDLPPLHARALLRTGELRRGARRLDEGLPYGAPAGSAYARLMREWPGFGSEAATAHVIRWLPRDYPIFARMQPGDEYPRAVRLAESMLARKVRGLPLRMQQDGRVLAELRAQIVPPYDAGKFPNKWRKMEPDAPARTLMAHLGKDSYSHIHHDSAQARTISVREAARLQSFPDGFRFCGSMNAGFRQIGNAVPPLLAYALARHLRGLLGLRQQPDMRQRLGLLWRPTRSHAAPG